MRQALLSRSFGKLRTVVSRPKAFASYRQDMEKSRQRLYSYLVASGAFDYLALAPAGPPGIAMARDQGVADQQQCFSATSVYPGLPDRAMSKEEMGKFKQDLTQCMQKTLDGTPACVKKTRYQAV